MTDAMIGMVLDRSGSMWSMWADAVGGFNTFKNEQAGAEGTAWLTLNYFDHEVNQKYDAWDTKDIPDLGVKDDTIFPRGSTALIDATAVTIRDIEEWLEANDWFDGKVFIVVMTDGHENASRTPGSELKGMVEAKEAEGWEFVYLAANVDTEATATQFGFNVNSSLTYDNATAGAAYGTMSNAILRSRTTGAATEFTVNERDVRESQ